MTEPDSSEAAPRPTRDAFFGGRLPLTQPAKGHRSGTDAVLLAAAVPPRRYGLCYDMGSGVGAVGLGVAVLRTVGEVVLVERHGATAALARDNAEAAAEARGEPVAISVARCDLLDRAALRLALPRRADLVVTNPPFRDAARGRGSPDPVRRAAHVLDDGFGISDWLAACLDRLADRGTLVAIAAATALPDLLACLGKAGALIVKPVQPHAERPAHRVLVRVEKGSRAPFVLAAPLILHGQDGRFTAEADAAHRGDAPLDW